MHDHDYAYESQRHYSLGAVHPHKYQDSFCIARVESRRLVLSAKAGAGSLPSGCHVRRLETYVKLAHTIFRIQGTWSRFQQAHVSRSIRTSIFLYWIRLRRV